MGDGPLPGNLADEDAAASRLPSGDPPPSPLSFGPMAEVPRPRESSGFEMEKRTTKPRPAKGLPDLGAGWWILSGLVGITAGVALVAAERFAHLSPAAEAIIAVGLGWLTMLAFTPWSRIRRAFDARREIRQLTRHVRDFDRDGRRESLRKLRTDRKDEIGELGRAIYGTLANAAAHQMEVRQLRRSMDHSIRRETDRATGRLQRQVATEPLTGLGNRRALQERLEQYVVVTDRQAEPLTALMIDVDRFKPINDRLGHEAGDRCLAFLGKVLRSGLGGEDGAFRTGGDEFIVLLPGQPASAGKTMAERFAALFRQMPWPHADPARPSLSIGVASAVPAELMNPAELIRRADEAMYAAKSAGRARICVYGDHRSAA